MKLNIQTKENPWTVADLREILADYPQDAVIYVTRYPSFRAFIVRILWMFPFLAGWAQAHDLYTFPACTPDGVSGSPDRVEIS